MNGSNTTGTEYVYDANGNLTQDLNKKISNIQYNMLNLPLSVQFSTGAKINYVYGTDGVKRKTTHQSGSTTTTIDYCDNVIYENGVLSKILTEEGYVTLNGSTPTYHYYLKDHLGNNRVVMNNSGIVEQVNHYYPFGGSFGIGTDTSNQPFKFGGKELDKANGLNWYDFGARGYDPELGRFIGLDPLSEHSYSFSSYAYCGNNPINYIDPDGRDWYRTRNENGKWVYEFNDQIHSQEALNEMFNNAVYLGKTYTDGNVYYSMFGSQIKANSFEGSLYKIVDKAIKERADFRIEFKNNFGGEVIRPASIDLRIEGIYAKDSKYLGIDSHRNEISVNYEGSYEGIYYVNNGNMRGKMVDWIGDNDMPKHIGGWQSGKMAYHIRFQNSKRADILHLKYNSSQAKHLLKIYNNLFFKDKK